MHRRRRLAAALVALALFPAVTASAAEEDPERPGVPLLTEPGSQWSGVATQGTTMASKARQAVRLPPMRLAAYVHPRPRTPNDSTCTAHPPYSNIRDFTASAFVLPDGDSEGYGHSASFTVRSLAFGAVPVEITLRVDQLRDADGLVEPWRLAAPFYIYCAGRGPNAGPTQQEQRSSGELEGGLRLQVEQVRVDGQDLRVARTCRTEDAPVRLTARTWYSLDPDLRAGERTASWDIDTTRYYQSAEGGLLVGMVDIPAFRDCTTSGGDDVTALLTGLVSSEGNPIQVRQSQLVDTCTAPAGPGAQCKVPQPMPLPSRND